MTVIDVAKGIYQGDELAISELDLDSLELQDDEDSEGLSGATEIDFDSLLVAPVDWTVGTLNSLIGTQIDLDPAFQRRAVWSQAAKSRLIESLILSVPVPQILLAAAKSDKNKYVVIDGKQRLLAIYDFINKTERGTGFRLRGLTILTTLNGKNWSDFEKDDKLKNSLLNESIRTTVLRGWSKDSVLYEIFNRLNSASVKLSPMELRMSLHPGPFLKYIIASSEELQDFQKSIGQSRPDPRMKDVELLIRFLAMTDGRWSYTGNLKQFLDDACNVYNLEFEATSEKIVSRLQEIDCACRVAVSIFGREFSKKYSASFDGAPKYESRFNRAIFEIVIYSLLDKEVQNFAEKHPVEVKQCFETLSLQDTEFVQSLSTSTKNVAQTKKRFEAWLTACGNLVGKKLAMPQIVGNI